MDGWCITCCVQGSLKFQVLKLNKVDNMAGLLALPLRCCATTRHLIHNRAPRFLELLILHLLLDMHGNSSRENLSMRYASFLDFAHIIADWPLRTQWRLRTFRWLALTNSEGC